MNFHARTLRNIFLVTLCVAQIATPGVSAADNAATAARIEELMTRTFPPGAPGAAVIVVQRGEVLVRQGYGSANLDRYVGNYELKPNFVLSVKREGDALTAQATGQSVTHLVAESPTLFRVRQVPATVEFKTDESGGVTGLVLSQNGREIPGPRIK